MKGPVYVHRHCIHCPLTGIRQAHKEKASSPSQRRRSLSSEPELSDVTDEEGEIHKEEEEERKFKESLGTPKSEKPIREELEKLRVSRQLIMKNYHAPWFDEWITGEWSLDSPMIT